jgi:hypothetical protein
MGSLPRDGCKGAHALFSLLHDVFTLADVRSKVADDRSSPGRACGRLWSERFGSGDVLCTVSEDRSRLGAIRRSRPEDRAPLGDVLG